MNMNKDDLLKVLGIIVLGAQRCFKPNTLEPCLTHYKPFKRDTFHFVVNLYLIRNLYIILLTVFGSNPLSDKTKGIGIIKRSFSLSGLQGSYINCEVTLTVNGKNKTFVPKAICNGEVSDGIYVRPRIG